MNEQIMVQIGVILMLCAVIMALSIAFHELGHILYFRFMINKKTKLRIRRDRRNICLIIGKVKDYEGLTRKQKYELYQVGIIFGALIILIAALIFSSYLVLLLIPYLIGCKSDIINMKDNWEW